MNRLILLKISGILFCSLLPVTFAAQVYCPDKVICKSLGDANSCYPAAKGEVWSERKVVWYPKKMEQKEYKFNYAQYSNSEAYSASTCYYEAPASGLRGFLPHFSIGLTSVKVEPVIDSKHRALNNKWKYDEGTSAYSCSSRSTKSCPFYPEEKI